MSPDASVFTGTVTFTVSDTVAAVAMASTSMPTAPMRGTVTVAWPAAFTATVLPVQPPAAAAPLITSQ